MLNTSTIVCVIDSSAASRQSLALAAKMAGDLGAKMVIVHPVNFHNWSIYSLVIYNPKRDAAEAAGRIEASVREIMSRTPEVKWELKVQAGDPAVITETAAEEAGADLVVSARRGRLEVLKSSSRAAPVAGVLNMAGLDLPPRPAPVFGEPHQAAAASN